MSHHAASDQTARDVRSLTVIHDAGSRVRHPVGFLMAFGRDFRESWAATKTLLIRNLTLRYRYSSLGLVWALAPPLVASVALSLGQKMQLLNSGKHGVSLAFYGVFGVLMAQTFLESMNLLRGLFTSHHQLLARNNTPLEPIIFSSFLEECFHTMIRIAVVMLAFVFSIKASYATFVLIFPGFFGLVLAGGGIGLMLAPLSSLKGDLDKAMAVFPWVFFAVTPVFIQTAEKGLLHDIFAINPLAWVFDSIRHAAYGSPGSLQSAFLIFPVGLLIAFAGCLWCRLTRPYVMERSLH